MAGGNYEVIGYFPGTDCTSDTVSIEILNLNAISTPPYEIYTWIYEISPLDNCDVPNGSLGAFVYTQTSDGSFPASVSNPPQDTLKTTDGYSFIWRITNDATNTTISTNNEIQNLTNQSYTIDIEENFSGCVSSAALTVSSSLTFPANPTITVVSISTCGGSGTLSADVNGNTSDFTFEWFDGPEVKPTADFTGVTYTVTQVGDYTVRAIQTNSGCASDPITGTMIDASSAPVGSLSVDANNTSCVSGNGIISADGDGTGTVAGFTFQWFKGANTLPASMLPGTAEANAFLVSNNPYQLGGLTGSIYTVIVTETATACSDTLNVPVLDTPATFTVTPASMVINNINSCDTATLGSIDASGIVQNVSSISAGNINSSFENLDILSATNHNTSLNGGSLKTFNHKYIDGWSTTASDSIIEIWHSNNSVLSGGVYHDAYHGDQFVEINANETAALYFDLSTNPGTLLNWSFAHKGRLGTDVISVNIGEPGAGVVQGTFSTGHTAWSFNEGVYRIPTAQVQTRFQFEAVSTSDGSNSTGNFVDTISFVLFPYLFELYEGTSTSGTADFMNTNGVFSDLDDGDFVLVVSDNLTGCSAAEVPFSITRSTDEPTIVTSLTHDTKCDSGVGSIDVTASMSGAEPPTYTYQLFDGHSFATQNGSNVSINDGSVIHPFTGLDPGDYRINVINDASKCSVFEDVVINNAIITPVILSDATNDNTSCMVANGSVSVVIDGNLDGIADPASDFRYTWYDGDEVTDPVVVGANSIAGLDILNTNLGFAIDAGFYTVVAESSATGCSSAPRTMQVFTTPYIPDVVVVEVSPQTLCGSGDGSLRAYTTNDPNLLCTECTANFTFQWSYNGTPMTEGVDPGNGSIPIGVTASTISGLVADPLLYSVQMTHTDLGCSASNSLVLSENQTFPILTLDTDQNNDTCDPAAYTGLITVRTALGVVNPVSDLTGYTFTWYKGSGASKTLNATSTSQTLSNIAEGDYSVVVQASNGCSSDTIVLAIIDVLPVIAPIPSAQANNTVCNPTANDPNALDANGTITFTPTTGTQPAAAYSFALRTTGGTAIATTADPTFTQASYSGTGTTSTVIGLPLGNYIMNVSDDANTCDIDYPFTIANDVTQLPIINQPNLQTTTTDNTTCDATSFTGMANATTYITGGSGTYLFSWARATSPGVVFDDDAILDDDANGNNGVEDGDYILTVTDSATGCVGLTTDITIAFTPAIITPETTLLSIDYTCDPTNPTGSVTGQVSGGGNAGFTFEWFAGTTATGTPISTTNGVANTITSQNPGSYTLKITDNTTRCFVTETIPIIENNPVITVAALIVNQNQTTCNASNGQITVTSDVAISGTTTGYTSNPTYRWYNGQSALLGNLIAGQTAATITQRTAGWYTVVVVDSTSGCESNPMPIEVIDMTPPPPTITITVNATPSSCADQAGELSATVTNNGGGLVNFFWYEGSIDFANNDPSGGNALASGINQLVQEATADIVVTHDVSGATSQLTAIVSGNYTLVVQDASGCRHQATYDLPFNGIQTTTTLNVVHVTECPDNGQADVSLADNQVITPSVQSGSFTTLEAYISTGTAAGFISNDNGTTIQLSVLSGTLSTGDVITGTLSGATATVNTVSNAGYRNDEADDIAEYIVYLYAGSGVPANRTAPYSIVNSNGVTLKFPYKFNPVSGNVKDGDGQTIITIPAVSAGGTVTFTDLPAGPYTAIAREIPSAVFGSGDECWSTSASDIINQEAYKPIINTVSITDDSFCNTGTGNGAITVTATKDVNDTTQPGDFTFDWYNSASTLIQIDSNATTSTLSSQDAGTYSVTVSRQGLALGIPASNKCDTTATYSIPENQEVHEIDIAPGNITHNTDCSPFDGAIAIGVGDITLDVPANYIFDWFASDGTTQLVMIPYDALAVSTFQTGETITINGNETATVVSDNGTNLIASALSGTISDNQGIVGGTSGTTADINNVNAITTTGSLGVSQFSGLEAGTYFVRAVHSIRGCLTNTFEAEVQDQRVYPIIQITANLADESCDNVTATGAATANVIIGGTEQTATNYSFTWYSDAGLTSLVPDVNIMTVNNGDSAANVAIGLQNATYYVIARDITNSIGCENSPVATVVIDQFDPTYSVGTTAATDFNITHIDDCNPLNGAYGILQITETQRDGTTTVATPLADFVFDWFDTDGTTQLVMIPYDALAVSTFQTGETITINGNETATVVSDNGTNLIASALSGTISDNQGIVGGTSGTTADINNANAITTTGSAAAATITGLNAGTYFVNISSVSTGCPLTGNQTYTFTLDDNTSLISLTKDGLNSTENTYCDTTPFVGNGTLTATITENGVGATLGDYSVEWYRGAFAVRPVAGTLDNNFLADEATGTGNGSGRLNSGDAIVGANILTIEGLSAGSYTVFITKDINTPNIGCTQIATFNVGFMNNILTLDVTAMEARVLPDTLCNTHPQINSGLIELMDADVSTGDLQDFNIEVRIGTVAGAHVPGSPFTTPVANTITIPNLAANDYYIIAQHATTRCSIATAIINVPDQVRDPQIGLVSITSDQRCGTSAQIGGVEVIIDNMYTHTDHFTVQWVNDATTNNVSADFSGVTDNEVILTGVPAGNYTITVTNNNTNCSQSMTYTVPNEPINPSIFSYTVVNNTICDDNNILVDNGSFDLIEAVFDGVVVNKVAMTGNYTLEIYSDVTLNSPVIDNAPTSPFLYEELSAGTYYATVTRDDSDCSSSASVFEIQDEVIRPVITITLQAADSTCGLNPNGTLFSTANGGIQDTDPDYTFQWYLGSGTGTPLANGVLIANGSTPNGVTTSTISGLATDTYTLEITRISSGCITTDEFIIPHNPIHVEILQASLTNSTACVPENGVIQITSVGSSNVTDYTFEYYDTDPTVGSPTPAFTGLAGASFTAARGETTYYVIGINTILGCSTLPFEVLVGEDYTFPEIILTNGEDGNNENCNPTNYNGFLTIEADGVVPSGSAYTLQWYRGADSTTPLTDAEIGGHGTLTGETTATVSGIPGGQYTVSVQNNATGCISLYTDRIEDRPRDAFFNVNTSSVTNCDSPDGSMTLQIVLGLPISSYDVYWFNDAQTNPDTTNADYTGVNIDGLPYSAYTVSVVEKGDRFCQSVESFDIFDETQPIEYNLEVVTHVTTCLDLKHGYAEVTVPDFSRVLTPEWFDDRGILVSRHFFADSLKAGTYTLRLTDVNTRCVAQEVFHIDNNAITPADPTIIANNNRTNCSEPNGNATANTEGQQSGFLFEWFAENDLVTPYAIGPQVFSLDSTTYLVRATNIATGCESALSSITIEYEITDPVFDIQFSIATCLRTDNGAFNQFNGTATVKFEEYHFVKDYKWFDADGTLIGTDSRLIDVGPGQYSVTFTANNGCEYSESFTMTTGVKVYNGLSVNGDKRNDFFLIDCLDFFPVNEVTVFNRDGVKVFEIDNYDNVKNRFEGISNVGFRLNLPSGTYFYVIDKRDGTDPIQGYLELVR